MVGLPGKFRIPNQTSLIDRHVSLAGSQSFPRVTYKIEGFWGHDPSQLLGRPVPEPS